LTGQYRGAGPVTIVTDLQKVAAFRVAQWSHRPIVDDQNINASDTIQKFGKLPSARATARSFNRREPACREPQSITDGF
jgi:hypothetical protein